MRSVVAFGIASLFFIQVAFAEGINMNSAKRLINDGDHFLGVFIYSRTFNRYSSDFSILAGNCKNYGFNHVYLSIKRKLFQSSKEYRDNIGKAVEEFHKLNIGVEALVFNDAVPFFNMEQATDDVKAIIEYNSTADKGKTFDGIASDLEPNSIKSGKADFPASFTCRWSKDGFGAGHDNDKIMNMLLNILKETKKQSGALPVSQTVSTSYTKDVLKKKLTNGTVNDFTQICAYVIEMAYYDTSKKVYSAVKTDLKESRNEKSIVICVKAKKGDAPDTFARMNKDEFAKALSDIIEKASTYKSFKGMAVYDYEGFEDIIKN